MGDGCVVHNVPLCRIGRWNGRELTADAFREMVANEDPDFMEACINYDHEGGPALGRVVNLRFDGYYLYGDLVGLSADVRESILDGRWSRRSIECKDFDDRGWVLIGLALLGGRSPAVTALPRVNPGMVRCPVGVYHGCEVVELKADDFDRRIDQLVREYQEKTTMTCCDELNALAAAAGVEPEQYRAALADIARDSTGETVYTAANGVQLCAARMESARVAGVTPERFAATLADIALERVHYQS